VGDLTGNLSQVLNLNPDSNATQIFSELTTNISGSITSSTAEQTQADNLVKATQALQTAQSGVNTDAQMAQAVAYQNAYEAAVRMQYVLFDMLNLLITETGSPNPTAPTGA
jgi:flagellar hook-associated protein FlgK